jgi:putative transposase
MTNYRRKVFADAMLTFCEPTMHDVCTELDVELIEFNAEANHLRLLIACRRKRRTAYAVRREYTGVCVRARMRGHLWSPSYFAISCQAHP